MTFSHYIRVRLEIKLTRVLKFGKSQILPYKIVQIAQKILHRLNNSPSFYRKNYGQVFSSLFASFIKVEYAEDIFGSLKNHQKLHKFGQNGRKSIYRLSSLIYRR